MPRGPDIRVRKGADGLEVFCRFHGDWVPVCGVVKARTRTGFLAKCKPCANGLRAPRSRYQPPSRERQDKYNEIKRKQYARLRANGYSSQEAARKC